MELHGKYVFLAEGVRGSLSKQVIAKYGLQDGHDVQKYGLGMKEIWEIKPENHKLGQVTNTMGWPLGGNAGGGSFMYHLEDNQVYVGFVVHLNYENPHLFPYMEFQRFKHHPEIAKVLEGGKRVAYGARAISEGGWQSLPKLTFPGGVLLGCAAGMVNVPRIKGNHNAMLSGKAAAEAAHAALAAGRGADELTAYEKDVRTGPIAPGPEKGPQRQAALVEIRHADLAGGRRAGYVVCLDLRRHDRHDVPWQDGCGGDRQGPPISPRSIIPNPMASCPSTG